MKHIKTPDDFDTYDEFDAYMYRGDWRRDRSEFASDAEWNEYLAERSELGKRLRQEADRAFAEARALEQEGKALTVAARLSERGVPADQALGWAIRTAHLRKD